MGIEDILTLSWIWLGFSIIVFIYDRKMIQRVGVIETNYNNLNV